MTNPDEFQSNRPLLFSVAYRMLGSANDAEDVVQDAWLRFSSAQPEDIRSSKAWLTTIVTRLCLDRLKSARATREEYMGPWLPEPVLTSAEEDPTPCCSATNRSRSRFWSCWRRSRLRSAPSSCSGSVRLLARRDCGDAADDRRQRPPVVAPGERAHGRAEAAVRRRSDEKRKPLKRFVAARYGERSVRAHDLLGRRRHLERRRREGAAARRPLHGRKQVVNLLLGLRRTCPAGLEDGLCVRDRRGERRARAVCASPAGSTVST